MSDLWVLAPALLSIFIIFSIIHKIAKNKKPFKRAFLSMLSGVLTLGVVNIAGGYFGICLPVSILSLIISAAGGISGVTLMLALRLFF